MKNNKLAFVGGGNMTRAIAAGLIDSGFEASDLLISEPVAEARESLARDLPGITISADNEAVVAAAERNAYTLSEQVRVWVRQGLAEADDESA